MSALIRAAALIRVALAGLRARPARSLSVAFAVALGVGILGGSLVYGDTVRAAFFADLARGARGIDVLVAPIAPGANVDAAEMRLSGLPDVAHVDRRVYATIGVIGGNGRVLLNSGQPGLAVQTPSWPDFAPYAVVAGRTPTDADEVALDVPTATREGLAPGERVRVAGRDGVVHELTLVGLVDFGVSEDYADRSVAVLSAGDLDRYATTVGPPSIAVAGSPGIDQAALAQQIRTALGAEYTVTTGDELRLRLATQAAKYASSFVTTLRVASIVALAATMLVVYNTFQIVAMQRRCEYALLRCVGFRRGQLIRLVLAESALIGVGGSIGATGAGVVAGLVFVLGRDAFGGGLPDFDLVVTPSSLLLPAAVALAATVISGVIPAIVAGRTAPVSALREVAGPGRRRPYALVVAAALAVAAVVGGLLIMRTGRGHGFEGLPAMVAGSMVIFAVVTVSLPLVITWLAAPVRRLLAVTVGIAGRLAVDNARRHPTRSAATTAAMAIGLAPLATFAVLLATAEDQAGRELAENFPLDYVVSDTTDPPQALNAALVEQLRIDPAFGVVALARTETGLAGNVEARVGSVEPGFIGSGLALEVRVGDPAGLPTGTVAVRRIFAQSNGWEVGDGLDVSVDGAVWPARVVALYDNSPLDVDILASWPDFVASGAAGQEQLLIRRADGISAAEATRALDQALEGQPFVAVTSQADRRESVTGALQRRLAQFTVLFGVSVVIGVLGIVNALYMAVAERTAESALLRALGLPRRQLYATVVIEAGLSAVVGASIGVAFGVGLGWVAAKDLVDHYGHGSASIPVATIAVYVAVAAVGAVLAALLPARRAARAAPVDAMRAP